MSAPIAVSALYVEREGPYSGIPGVDVWDLERDARGYRGPHPVVAHPPCKRWGKYWYGGPSSKERLLLGDDNGCFAAALWAVRTFGGVLEHPEGSSALHWFGLPTPSRLGWGWGSSTDRWGGRSCLVTQGRYGHRARKLTWLYAVIPVFPRMDWGDCSGVRLDEGFHTAEERAAARSQNRKPLELLTRAERIHTPPLFRDALLAMARSAHTTERDENQTG